MTDLDLSRAFRSLASLRELVGYVLGTHKDNETTWLEWKCGLDLTKQAGRFAVAKQILGFANRDPGKAAPYAEGCGYVILGAEPGNLQGQSSIDPAQLEAGLTPFLGTDGPSWLPTTVDLNGALVIVINIEAPRWGDPIHTLRKDFRPAEGGGGRDGDVFVRRPGGSHPASSDEMRMLERRVLSNAARDLDLVVQSIGEPLPRVDVSEDAVQTWIDAERQRLLRPLATEQALQQRVRDPTAATALVSSELLKRAAWASQFGGLIKENRNPDQYRAEIEDYLTAAATSLLPHAINQFCDHVDVLLCLRVINTSDRNLDGVEVVVSFAGPVVTVKRYEVDMPPAPRIWGPRSNALGLGHLGRIPNIDAMLNPFPLSVVRGYSARNEGSTTIEFDPVHLSPKKERDLPEVPLMVSAQLEGQLTGSWTATARNRDGRATGSVTIPLAETIVPLDVLVAPPTD